MAEIETHILSKVFFLIGRCISDPEFTHENRDVDFQIWKAAQSIKLAAHFLEKESPCSHD